MLKTDTWLVIICSMMVNAIVFGVGTITVLSVEALSEYAKYLIPAVVVVSIASAPFISAYYIAPRMRIRHWGRRGWREGDLISG